MDRPFLRRIVRRTAATIALTGAAAVLVVLGLGLIALAGAAILLGLTAGLAILLASLPWLAVTRARPDEPESSPATATDVRPDPPVEHIRTFGRGAYAED